jgi:hypothetical protein
MPKIPDAGTLSLYLLPVCIIIYKIGGLVVIKDEESAFKAIQNIVREGEGFQGPYDDDDRQELSHYQRFRKMEKNSGMNLSHNFFITKVYFYH